MVRRKFPFANRSVQTGRHSRAPRHTGTWRSGRTSAFRRASARHLKFPVVFAVPGAFIAVVRLDPSVAQAPSSPPSCSRLPRHRYVFPSPVVAYRDRCQGTEVTRQRIGVETFERTEGVAVVPDLTDGTVLGPEQRMGVGPLRVAPERGNHDRDDIAPNCSGGAGGAGARPGAIHSPMSRLYL
jgi:hypothetical protein